MLLSTSNSEARSWWITWLLTAVMLLVSLWAYESFLANKGFRPSVDHNKDLWSWHRWQASGKQKVLVLLGASRIQLGLHTDTLRQKLPDYKVESLTINGQYPIATLEALAADESFNGLVVMSFMAQMLEPQYWDMQLGDNQYYQQKFSYYLALDAVLTAKFKAKFNFLNPILGLKDVVKTATKKHAFPDAPYVFGHADGSATGDYSLINTAPLKTHFIQDKLTNYQENPPMGVDMWSAQIDKIKQYIDAIQARGGQVVLLRFPTDDGHWALDEQYYPRKVFWDEMVKSLPNVLAIHFHDDEILSSFTLPDSSHLDEKDAKLFTIRLIEILQSKDSLP